MIIQTNPQKIVDKAPNGIKAGVSYDRLILIMRAAGEISAKETITYFDIDEWGITYTIEDIKDDQA